MNDKSKYLDATKEFLESKITVIENALKDTQSSANSDTKSSAGDKHETSRAMAHIENERLAGQLTALQEQIEMVNKINPSITSGVVSFGSIIKTETNTFFISTGIGKISNSQVSFYAIASNSPVGQNFLGKKIGDSIKIGMNSSLIVSIL